jgi:kinetochore protein Spc25
MRFTLIDPADPNREFSILIDISKQEYSSKLVITKGRNTADDLVPKVSPHLPQLSEMLSDLNEDRDFTGFIKRGTSAVNRGGSCKS